MADYVAIADAEIEPERPITTSLMSRMRDNAIAIAEAHADAPRVKPMILHVRHEETSGTGGGSNVGGLIAETRELNAVKLNEIAGASVSVNQITLPAGVYDIIARAQAYSVSSHTIRWRNITDGSTTLIGHGSRAPANTEVPAFLFGRFTIAAQKVFELQDFMQTGVSDTAFGYPADNGETEVYCDIVITKVG